MWVTNSNYLNVLNIWSKVAAHFDVEIQVLDSVSILNFVDHFGNSSPVAKFSARHEQDTILGPKDFLERLINFLLGFFYLDWFRVYFENDLFIDKYRKHWIQDI